ncbi:hypothetical protein DC498_02390 [Terrimonas sp.]|uniref:hypothetical protein n=1 Tax=Terrimonas sp. TaxID=1914338 RepID=UPI000D50A946|nr:hypothetical protein [Terrimonas sp.]PVD54249.1 hypothetical protein DC498_02390 [Terrimonas sp.]
MHPIIQSILALLTGGAIWEGFKFIYPDIKRPITSRIEAKKSFYHSIDPILKSASELYGKLLSLAKEDFATFINPINSTSSDPDQNKKYIYYLFAQFWGQLEYLRLQNQYISLSKIKKGSHLLKFIETFEARKYRILDRSVQRIIGEHMISGKDQKFRVMTLHEFIALTDNNSSSLNKWILKLDQKFATIHNKELRQNILTFGIIIASLIDHFDPKHSTIRQRPYYTNKLTPKSKMTIKNNLFKYYLTFIKDKKRYYV